MSKAARIPAIDLQGTDALLLYAASERSADLYWATDFMAPDPFHYLCDGKHSWVLVKDLELDRAREQSCCDVLALTDYEPEEGTSGNSLHNALRKLGFHNLLVPADFPVATANQLTDAGFVVRANGEPLFAERAIKTPQQIEAIVSTQTAAEASMAAAVDALTQARIEGDQLWLGEGPLTSERVRRTIHHVLLDHDCTGHHTIVAGGEQAIDPHQAGHGPLPAHAPIIIDIFPRADHSGYFGDITRTFVRGHISEDVQRLYDTVLAAQLEALAAVRAGADGAEIHRGVQQHFESAGYRSGEIDGRMQGYFHGTGHGVGLDIHEAPSLGRRANILAAHQTLTVEPGLYYAGLGGVRIEDLVLIEADGYRNVTTFPKQLQL